MPESWNTVHPVTAHHVNDVEPLRLNVAGLNRTYGVSIALGAENQSNNFHYEISLGYTQLTGNQYLVEITKERVYINDKPAEQMIDEFAEKCGNILYPVKVLTNTRGEFIKVANYEEIKQRWNKEKESLSKYYEGDLAGDLITGMDRAVNNERHINQVIKNDWFFSLYFSPLYNINNNPNSNAGEIALPMLAYTQPLIFSITQTKDTSPTESKTFEIQQQGICTDARSAEDLLKGLANPVSGAFSDIHTPVEGAVELNYKVYLADCSISSITCKSKVLIGATERIAEISIYHLREKDRLKDSNPALLVEEQAEQPEKKKGFFSFLFN
ncbi:hypothetical protein [Mucilaginibacter polytrichastri]|uniref:Uncharacterized protein n=1 Tax=Mucilaginibacter polytrichastri TaxID=1302689 RepID=A0A1Q5ZYY8_9SPHI|nr:hypothetical protein [Mucilaginibacter polytrichastri]OKS86985.1 hypothetical protein RG47T_2443 [Mucilaginibacter polytrichastri]SFS85449.1 hypothetical protein SAMN04487890_10552 [Mucilaginibacter polytrichastri]